MKFPIRGNPFYHACRTDPQQRIFSLVRNLVKTKKQSFIEQKATLYTIMMKVAKQKSGNNGDALDHSDLNKTLNAISKLTRDWPGNPIDRLGTVRFIHPHGNREPIVWVFNSKHEPINLAYYFGDSQPLIALRSLNIVMQPSPERENFSHHLALHYAQIITQVLPRKVTLIGGNCQGAPIALRIANALHEKGHEIQGLVTIDAVPRIKCKHPILMNFGNESLGYNPFARNFYGTTETVSSFYPYYTVSNLPCDHGQYFNPENIPFLVENIEHFLKDIRSPSIVKALVKIFSNRFWARSLK